MESRPILRCVLAIRLPNGEYLVKCGKHASEDVFDEDAAVSLEEAADFARFGWEVIVDPFDEEMLARWEQIQRSMNRPRFFRRHQGNSE